MRIFQNPFSHTALSRQADKRRGKYSEFPKSKSICLAFIGSFDQSLSHIDIQASVHRTKFDLHFRQILMKFVCLCQKRHGFTINDT